MTPKSKNTSSNFEWTIDEVSTLRSVHLEPYETQFQETPDPEMEKKAQEAIQSFFKEHEIVPSPKSTSQSFNNFGYLHKNISKEDQMPPAKRRNAVCQTVLTLPPILPKHVEDVLSTYFNFTEDQQQVHEVDVSVTNIDYEARDASLRRKLFEQSFDSARSCDIMCDIQNDLAHLSPPPQSPEINTVTRLSDKSNSFFDNSHHSIQLSPIRRESFGALSPISKSESPPNKSKLGNDRRCDSESSIIIGSTPERLTHCRSSQFMEISSDSKRFDRSYEEMQISQQSIHPTTPLRSNRMRSTNRKNLSQSFLLFETNDDTKVEGNSKLPKTDSGFNEVLDNVNDYNFDRYLDISMKSVSTTDTEHLISSTPSKNNLCA